MTLVFCDSVAHYSGAQAMRKYEDATFTVIAAGRFGAGSYAIRLADTRARKTIPAQATYAMGFAFKPDSIQAGPIAEFLDTGIAQVVLEMLADGRLRVTRAGVTLGTSAVALKGGVWCYLELKVLVDPAAGTVLVRLNGATVINLVGQNTRATATSQITQAGWRSQAGVQGYISDIYVCNTLGVKNNDVLGDCRVAPLFPAGAGAYTEFTTLVGAATQWEATDETAADDDASYIASATPGQRSTFATGNLPAGIAGVVAAVVVNHESRKDDAGTRTVAGMVRLAAVDAAGAGVNVGNTYAVAQEIFEADPSAAAWTVANVDAAEYGAKEVA